MPKEQKQSISLTYGKRFDTALSNENLRIGDSSAWKAKIAGTLDPTRTKFNFEVTKGGVIIPINQAVSIPKRIKEIFKRHGITDPNLGLSREDLQRTGVGIRTHANFILQGSHDTMLRLAFGEQQVDFSPGADNSHLKRDENIEKWAKDMYMFVAQKYGEDNIASFVVHLDETTAHAHCTVVPVTPDGKLSFRKVFIGESNDKYEFSRQTKQLHDEAAKISMKYGLKRGDDMVLSGAKHKSYLQWMREKMEELKKVISGQNATIDEQKQQLYDINREVKKAETRLKGLNTMLDNLEKHRLDVLADIEVLEGDVATTESEKAELDRKLLRLKADLEQTEEKIKTRRQQLVTATEQLRELGHKSADVQHAYDDMLRQINRELPTLQKKTFHDMEAIGWELASQEAIEQKSQLETFRNMLTPEQETAFNKLFDGSMVETMATRATEVTAMAATLFLGYLDEATQYAERAGGGGGPGSGWGRKKDEDDLTFGRRCFLLAKNMLSPSGGNGQGQAQKRKTGISR